MAKTAQHTPGVTLLRVALLAAIAAVIAGLLGMHVLSSVHGASATTGHPAVESQTTAAAGQPAPEAHHETPTPPSCVCGGGCGEQHAAHPSCTPAAPTASPSAPPPGTTLLTVLPRSGAEPDRLPAYSYRPATPTPSELSISRT